MTEKDFRERYALRRFRDGGIVIDLVTGNYSRTNRPATLICEALLQDDGERARAALASQLGVALDAVDPIIQQVLSSLAAPSPRRLRPDPFIYALHPDGEGYVLSANGVPKLLVTANGETIATATAEVNGNANLYWYLRALAPRLAFLQGGSVLHGAAFRLADSVVAICGDSGAGKTTTARSFAAAGAQLISEDMIVVDSTSPLRIKLLGEQAIHRWATDASDRLSQSARIDAAALRGAWDGDATPVHQLWFISANERLPGEAVVHAELGPIDATLTAMASLFLGGTASRHWRRFLDECAAIAASISVFRTRLPNGIEPLRRAASAYIRNSTS